MTCISPFQQIIFLGGSGQVGLPRSHVSRSLPAVRPAVSCSSAGRLNILGINRLLPVFFFSICIFPDRSFFFAAIGTFSSASLTSAQYFLATLSFWQLLCYLCEKLINWLIDLLFCVKTPDQHILAYCQQILSKASCWPLQTIWVDTFWYEMRWDQATNVLCMELNINHRMGCKLNEKGKWFVIRKTPNWEWTISLDKNIITCCKVVKNRGAF